MSSSINLFGLIRSEDAMKDPNAAITAAITSFIILLGPNIGSSDIKAITKVNNPTFTPKLLIKPKDKNLLNLYTFL